MLWHQLISEDQCPEQFDGRNHRLPRPSCRLRSFRVGGRRCPIWNRHDRLRELILRFGTCEDILSAVETPLIGILTHAAVAKPHKKSEGRCEGVILTKEKTLLEMSRGNPVEQLYS
jgi:hypothetical protein